MKHPSPTLAALALLGAASSGHAVSVKDDDVSLAVKFQLQVRATVGAHATDDYSTTGAGSAANGARPYDVYRNADGASEPAHFGVRRCRIGFDAKLADGWKGNVTLRVGESGTTGRDATGDTVQLYYAYVGKTFKTGDLEHEFTFGLDKPFNNESIISSTTFILPSDRVVAGVLDMNRNYGVAYRVSNDLATVGFDLRNNTLANGARDAETTDSTNADPKNGMYYSARVQISPPGMKPKKQQESYCGKEGTEAVLGFDWQYDQRRIGANTVAAPAGYQWSSTDTQVFGPDLLVHANQLTVLAEWRAKFTKVRNDSNSSTVPVDNAKTQGCFWDASIAYAIPTDTGIAIEPALRYAVANNKINANNAGEFVPLTTQLNKGDVTTASGTTKEAGVNIYWLGNHSSKTQVAFTKWDAEEGQSRAYWVTIQHQIAF